MYQLQNKIRKLPSYFHFLANSLEISITSNDKRLKPLKNIHKGERCFIIGNGPSLRLSDLDRLKYELTFACNKIFLAFDQTDWRPSYYTILDILVAEKNHAVVNELNLCKIFSSSVKPYFKNMSDIIWLRDIHRPVRNGQHDLRFSSNPMKGVHGGWTVIYTQLQIAFYMGIREVYLIGVDFSFKVPKPTGEICMHGEIIEDQGDQNHFHPKYREPGERWTMPRLDLQYEAFKCAQKFFETNNGGIYNASRKTSLDIFPLVDFDNIIS